MSKLAVKVVPSASRNEIAGWLSDVLKVRVTAPPERGKANAAVEETIAAALGVAGDRVRVASGHGSPRKMIEIDGLTDAEIRARLNAVTAD
jgi:uncharacterized protein (TIGR00251 family)